jgi:hypothetical protein
LSEGVKNFLKEDIAGEVRLRQFIFTQGQGQKTKYNEYIQPPGENDIWLARAVMFSLRTEGRIQEVDPPSMGAAGVCTFSNGSSEIGFSGDASKTLQYKRLLTDFLGLLKGIYDGMTLNFAMDSNDELIGKYYGSFKEVGKGGKTVQSTWERYCAESKFLDLKQLRTRPMASCTVLWIGLKSIAS